MNEPASIVVLTKDEAANLQDCLDAILPELKENDEILVVDSASTDGTLAIARRIAASSNGRVRVHASPGAMSFGRARNLGVVLARHDIIVFVSANAIPQQGWLAALRAGLDNADVVYGRQLHAPRRQTPAAVARGLEYRRFEAHTHALPEHYASNDNAAYRKYAFATLRFDETAPAAEDLAFALEARYAGLRIAYAPDAIVRHREATEFRAQWRRRLRDGAARARLRERLGEPRGELAWAFAVGGLGLLAVYFQDLLLLAGTILVFFAPTLRRIASPLARRYRAPALLAGAAAAPLFDVAYVASYLRRRWSP